MLPAWAGAASSGKVTGSSAWQQPGNKGVIGGLKDGAGLSPLWGGGSCWCRSEQSPTSPGAAGSRLSFRCPRSTGGPWLRVVLGGHSGAAPAGLGATAAAPHKALLGSGLLGAAAPGRVSVIAGQWMWFNLLQAIALNLEQSSQAPAPGLLGREGIVLLSCYSSLGQFLLDEGTRGASEVFCGSLCPFPPRQTASAAMPLQRSLCADLGLAASITPSSSSGKWDEVVLWDTSRGPHPEQSSWGAAEPSAGSTCVACSVSAWGLWSIPMAQAVRV